MVTLGVVLIYMYNVFCASNLFLRHAIYDLSKHARPGVPNTSTQWNIFVGRNQQRSPVVFNWTHNNITYILICTHTPVPNIITKACMVCMLHKNKWDQRGVP